jgi:CMP-N-acetylneuraminic acid synthetase
VHARVIEGGSLYGNETWPLIMTAEESLDVDTSWDLKLVEYSLQTRF